MKYQTLISVDGLALNYKKPEWAVVDCRFWLDDVQKGRRDYKKSHVPGAVYAHLDEDLSGKIIPGRTGRHPLPNVDKFTARLSSWGIGNQTQVVAYDDRGGMIAVRLWWLLRWLGHTSVAVLDGGFPAWIEAGLPVNAEIPSPDPQKFVPDVQEKMVVSAQDILNIFGDPGYKLVDSRAPERYRGENEPIDPIAGRIPGASNSFWNNNIDPSGHFELKDVLRGRFEVIIRDIPPEKIIFYCGSGVTAAHNVLAMVHSGVGMPKLYAGSWSHWITDPERPIQSD
jgi:thiosulfate/3-mercaptopyruvate sulfurtransferase